MPISGITQKRTGFLLILVPLKDASSCHLREIFLTTVASFLFIWDINLHPDFCKVVSVKALYITSSLKNKYSFPHLLLLLL